MTSRQLIFTFTILLVTPSMAFGEAQCPGNAETVRYHSVERSQIAISVTVNGSGPYEFVVDTGSQLTIVEPSLAAELKLQPQGSIGVAAIGNTAKAELMIPDVIAVGSYAVRLPWVAVEGLGQIQALNPKVRGILGETFLARFDLLIDHGHKFLCFDETKRLQQELGGEHIPIVEQRERQSDLPYTQPYLISVHMHGDGSEGTVLRLDSGANVPLLFVNHTETPDWRLNAHVQQDSAVGASAPVSYAVMPSQDVRIGTQMVRQIVFVTPVSTGSWLVGEDGLLPTTLFKRVLISYADHFVIFEPR
jgi:hypothetical protein